MKYIAYIAHIANGPILAALLLVTASSTMSCTMHTERVFEEQDTPEVAVESAPVSESSAEDSVPLDDRVVPAPVGAFPAEGVDHFATTVTLELDIARLGKDTVDLRGTILLHRSGPTGDEGKTMLGELAGASLRGRSNVFGNVVAMESPIQHSPCEFTLDGRGSYRGRIDVNAWFWLPEHGQLLFSAQPIVLQIQTPEFPPVGHRVEPTRTAIALYDFHDPGAKAVGTLTSAGLEIHDAVLIESYRKTIGTTVPALAVRCKSAPS